MAAPPKSFFPSLQPCVSNPSPSPPTPPPKKQTNLSILRQTNEAFCQFAREYYILMCCQVHNRNLITVLTFALKRGERGRSPCLATVPRCSSALLRFLSPSTDGYYSCLAEILKQNETHKSLLISPLTEWAIETFQGLLPSDAPLCVCVLFFWPPDMTSSCISVSAPTALAVFPGAESRSSWQ